MQWPRSEEICCEEHYVTLIHVPFRSRMPAGRPGFALGVKDASLTFLLSTLCMADGILKEALEWVCMLQCHARTLAS